VELTRLRVIERLNVCFAVAISLGSLAFWRRDVLLGTAVGASLSALNFHVIRRVTAWVLASRSPRKLGLLMSLLVLKMAALIALVYLVVRHAPIHAPAFALGLSTFLLSILLAGLGVGANDGSTPRPRRSRRGIRRQDTPTTVES
jgi:hypothetical protein